MYWRCTLLLLFRICFSLITDWVHHAMDSTRCWKHFYVSFLSMLAWFPYRVVWFLSCMFIFFSPPSQWHWAGDWAGHWSTQSSSWSWKQCFETWCIIMLKVAFIRRVNCFHKAVHVVRNNPKESVWKGFQKILNKERIVPHTFLQSCSVSLPAVASCSSFIGAKPDVVFWCFSPFVPKFDVLYVEMLFY